MKFTDANGELWLIKIDQHGDNWLINDKTGASSLWAGQCWPVVYHYGPGGEYLPDAQPRIRMEPKGFLARFLYAWRAARTKG